jgi:hypothetical protein
MKTKIELKPWGIYFATILTGIYIHEIGHCIPAWVNGYSAIPTPAKEYISNAVPSSLTNFISLGGIIGSVLASLVIIGLFLTRKFKYGLALLAAAIAMPGMYTLRFFLAGRGHDATEFQEAQSALGLSYSGHSLDWIFLLLFVLGIAVWIWKTKPNYKSLGTVTLSVIFTFIFVIGLQVINNVIFDPIFLTK